MKLISLRLEEGLIKDLKDTANIFNINYVELIREGIVNELKKRHEDPRYKIVYNVKYASQEEENEIMDEVNSLTNDDLMIVKREKIEL